VGLALEQMLKNLFAMRQNFFVCKLFYGKKIKILGRGQTKIFLLDAAPLVFIVYMACP
jgi:hypothetical protein